MWVWRALCNACLLWFISPETWQFLRVSSSANGRACWSLNAPLLHWWQINTSSTMSLRGRSRTSKNFFYSWAWNRCLSFQTWQHYTHYSSYNCTCMHVGHVSDMKHWIRRSCALCLQSLLCQLQYLMFWDNYEISFQNQPPSILKLHICISKYVLLSIKYIPPGERWLYKVCNFLLCGRQQSVCGLQKLQ